MDEYLNSLAFRKLDGTAALAELKKLSAGVPRLEGRILVVMLTLDASGEPWRVSWLSQAAAAQKGWPGRIKNP